ncbi:hypothetical protein DEA8626_03999 [Defluviimonas aquaemixtae]|uniref:Uncharacterized protein n=1 Tax=Albidovulum aquaemixtae TaxID=1542388 RepID=A0A2R8BNN5_9RHOB|nr:hypothetical protein [Defluviimonas aquaemixtae]SPH24966.1 hypothetical protein DEA8626_03999 [Defluviimonas aquaemixtae]
MTRRISPFATDFLLPAALGGGEARAYRPAPDDPPPERRTRRAKWFVALRNRSRVA